MQKKLGGLGSAEAAQEVRVWRGMAVQVYSGIVSGYVVRYVYGRRLWYMIDGLCSGTREWEGRGDCGGAQGAAGWGIAVVSHVGLHGLKISWELDGEMAGVYQGK